MKSPASMSLSSRSLIASRHWPYLFVSVAPLLLFAPFLAGFRVLYWGTPLLQFYPWRKFAIDTILSGHLPLWNPYLGNGAPLIANLQSAVFYPPNWLSFILPLDYSLSWLVVLHLIWAGAGMVTLSRALGMKPLGQVVAGLAFGLSQYLVARAWFFSINAAVAWMPWIIWAAEQGLRPEGQARAKAQYAWWLALFVAMQLLAGHAQTAWYTLLLLAAWVIWRTFSAWKPADLPSSALSSPVSRLALHASCLASHVFRSLLSSSFFLLPIGLAFLLAALQLLPTAELLRQSPRATSADYEFVMTYSFSPWRLLTLLAPDLLGNPAHGKYYGYGNYWEDAVYVGLLPLLLAAFGMAQPFKTLGLPPNHPLKQTPHPTDSTVPRSLVVLLLGGLLVSLLLALGRNTPIFPFLYRHVPTFNLFQAPARMMVWFVFALALLAGLGADQWPAVRGGGRRWLLRAAAGSASVIITAALFIAATQNNPALGQQFYTVSRALILLGFGLCLTVVLALWRMAQAAGKRTFAHAWELAVAFFISADLMVAGYGLNPGALPDLYRAPTASGAVLREALEGHRLFQPQDDEYQVKYLHFLSFKNFGSPELARETREAQIANAALLDGLASANNYEPLVSARYAGFMQVLSDTRSLRLLQLMDVGIMASSTPLGLEQVTTGGPLGFYRVPGGVRRVRSVYAARTVPDAASALAALADPHFDPDAEVILESQLMEGATGGLPVSSLTASPNALTIPASFERAGWLVLSDTCYPGWAAFVDGRPAPLWCADYAFRAVAVPQGEHVVAFQYQPRSFELGLLLTSVGCLLWLGSGAALWFVKRFVRNPV